MMDVREESGENLAPLLPETAYDDRDWMDDRNMEENQTAPAIATLFKSMKHRIWQFRYLLKVVLGNVISFALSAGLVPSNSPEFYHMHHYGRGDSIVMIKTMISAGMAISLLTFLVDAYLCYHGSQEIEKRMIRDANDTTTTASTVGRGERTSVGDTQSPSTTTPREEDGEYDVCAASRRLDGAFGCTTTPQTTFLVCLLYGLFSFFVWLSVDNGVGFVQFYFLPTSHVREETRCFAGGNFRSWDEDREEEEGIASLQTCTGFSSLPSKVQAWIKSNSDSRSYVIVANDGEPSEQNDVGFNQSRPYLQLTDGTIIFSKQGSSDRYSYHRSRTPRQKPGAVVYDPQKNVFEEYTATENKKSRHSFFDTAGSELIGFPTSPPYYGYCVHFLGDGPGHLQNEMLCSNLKTGNSQRFPRISDESKHWNGWGGGQKEMLATGDTLWMASDQTFSLYNAETKKISLISVDIAKMKREVVLDRNVTGRDTYRRSGGESTIHPKCVGYHWTRIGVSLLALVLVAAYFYRLQIPSCTVPASLAFTLTMKATLTPKIAGFAALSLACVCLYLVAVFRRTSPLWKYVSREMLVWALYTCQIASNMTFWSQMFYDGDEFFEDEIFSSLIPFPVFAFLVALATTILLNHPVFQVLAVCFGILCTFTFLLALVGPNLVLVPILGFTLALGCFHAGNLLQAYRVHVLVSTRMVYRACLQLSKRLWNHRRRDGPS